MKTYHRLVTAFAALAALATVATVQAQQDVRVIARIPFEFAVGDTTLPRDTYRLSQMNGHPEMLLLRSERSGAFVRVAEVKMARDDTPPSLVFHRYGDQYFLRQIRLEGTSRLDLPLTRAERDAADRRTDGAAAVMKTVVVAADR
ncbi:MAG TPA: hypothetical protein VL882_03250 [Vicinamibacterales bacterium]|jgi:hypothetical protein|nr:hypothetical protein [Vicinamibacterales bacterium]